LSVFINLRSAECVCPYYGLRMCYKQINFKKNKLYSSIFQENTTLISSKCFCRG